MGEGGEEVGEGGEEVGREVRCEREEGGGGGRG